MTLFVYFWIDVKAPWFRRVFFEVLCRLVITHFVELGTGNVFFDTFMSKLGISIVHFLVEWCAIKLSEAFIFVPIHAHDKCTRVFVCRLNDDILSLDKTFQGSSFSFSQLSRTLAGFESRNCCSMVCHR